MSMSFHKCATIATRLHLATVMTMQDALDKHGPLTRNSERAALILTEECGEVVAEVLSYTRPATRVEARAKLRAELLQVVATALFMLDNLQLDNDEEKQNGAKPGTN